jgi:hypothetical protein
MKGLRAAPEYGPPDHPCGKINDVAGTPIDSEKKSTLDDRLAL